MNWQGVLERSEGGQEKNNLILSVDWICNLAKLNATAIVDEKEYLQAFSMGVLNSILAVPTSILNLLIIIAIFTSPGLQTPSYYLLTSLAFSDFAMGSLCQPLYSVTGFSYINQNCKALRYFSIVSTFLSTVVISGSIITITAISIDRYLAITLKMRYRSTVTLPRIRCVLVSLWIMALVKTTLILFLTENLFGLVGATSHLICLFIIVFFYIKSFRALKIYCNQIQPQGSQQENATITSNAIDLLNYRKLLNTMVIVLVLIVICYLPLLVIFIRLSQGLYDPNLFFSILSIVGLHSTLNPVVYLIRMRDIRQACIGILKRLFRCKT